MFTPNLPNGLIPEHAVVSYVSRLITLKSWDFEWNLAQTSVATRSMGWFATDFCRCVCVCVAHFAGPDALISSITPNTTDAIQTTAMMIMPGPTPNTVSTMFVYRRFKDVVVKCFRKTFTLRRMLVPLASYLLLTHRYHCQSCYARRVILHVHAEH